MIVVELVFLTLVGVLLTNMQTDLSLGDQRDNIAEKLDEMDELLLAADASGVEITEAFDEENRGKVGSAAFHVPKRRAHRLHPRQHAARSATSWTWTMCSSSTRRAASSRRPAPRRRTSPAAATTSCAPCLSDGQPSAAFEVDFGDACYRYYGARIDDSAMAVVEKDAETLYHRLEASATLASALKNVTVGLNGFSFAISAKDYTFLYYPDETVIGQDAISMGLSVASLEDGSFGWMEIGGQRLYGGATLLDDTYILCAVTSEEILASRNTTVTIILFAVFVALTLVVAYAFFILHDIHDEKSKRIAGKLHFGTTVARKLASVSLIGLIAILVVSFYMQSIFALSRQSMSNNQRLQEISQRIDQYAAQRDELAAEYDELYLNKAHIAAFIIDTKPELADREKLAELSEHPLPRIGERL